MQGFSAQETFNGIFGSAVAPFWGGGAQIVLPGGVYAEVNVSRFRKEGERAFLLNGEATRLGLPLTATITPVEVTGGYRFRLRKHPGIVPYSGPALARTDYHENPMRLRTTCPRAMRACSQSSVWSTAFKGG